MSRKLIVGLLSFGAVTALNLWLESLDIPRPVLVVTWTSCYGLLAVVLLWPRIKAAWRAFWNNPLDSSGLVIYAAKYGTDGNYKDVTTIVQGYVKNNRVSMAVNNLTLQGDPVPMHPKHLKVRYSLNGKDERIIRHENDELAIP